MAKVTIHAGFGKKGEMPDFILFHNGVVWRKGIATRDKGDHVEVLLLDEKRETAMERVIVPKTFDPLTPDNNVAILPLKDIDMEERRRIINRLEEQHKKAKETMELLSAFSETADVKSSTTVNHLPLTNVTISMPATESNPEEISGKF